MVDRNKELAKNTIILGIGQLIPKFLSLILLPLLTAYLTTEEYGNYDLILSIASLLIPVVTLQIQQAVFRYLLSSSDDTNRKKYVTGAVLYIIVSSLVCYPVVFLCLRLYGIKPTNSLMICLLFGSEAVYTLFGQIVRGLGFNIKYSLSVVIYSAANLGFTAIMLMGLHLGLLGVLISLMLGYISADLFMLFSSGMLDYIDFHEFNKPALKQLIQFSAPIVPSSIALWVVNLSVRLIIIHFLGSAANGIYAVANKIPSLYSTAYNIFNLAWTETAVKVSDDGNPAAYYSKLFHVLFKFLIGVMLALIALTPVIFAVLVKGDYGVAIYQVPILYFGIFFNSLVNFYSGIYIALKRTKQVGYSSAAGAVLNVAMNLALVKQIGLYAASISTAVSFFVIVIYRALDLNKAIKIKYYFKEIAIGAICFVISSVCLFFNSTLLLILCWAIAIIYNLTQNMGFIRKILSMIVARTMMSKK